MASTIDECIALALNAVNEATTVTAGMLEIKEWADDFLAVVVTNIGPDSEAAQKSAAVSHAAEVASIGAEALLELIENVGAALAAQRDA